MECDAYIEELLYLITHHVENRKMMLNERQNVFSISIHHLQTINIYFQSKRARGAVTAPHLL